MADKEKYYIPIEGKLIEVKENVYIAYYKSLIRESNPCIMWRGAILP